MKDRPKKAIEIQAGISAHSLDDLRRILDDLYFGIEEGIDDRASSVGYWYKCQRREVTEEQWKAEVLGRIEDERRAGQ